MRLSVGASLLAATLVLASGAVRARYARDLADYAPSMDLSRLPLVSNTAQGLMSDLSNGYQSLASGAESGYKGWQNQMNSVQEGLASQYVGANELLRQAYAMVSDPQQFCSRLAGHSGAGGQFASQALKSSPMASAGDLLGGASSFMGSLGGLGASRPSSVLSGLFGGR